MNHQQQISASSTTSTVNRKNNNEGINSGGTTSYSGGGLALSSYVGGGLRDVDCSDILNDKDEDEDHQSCFCFESDDDSAERIKIKNTKRKIARSCVGNIVITILLIIYTLIGSIIFLLIEGGITDLSYYNYNNDYYNKLNYLSNYNLTNGSNNANNSLVTNFSILGEESRIKTVENIWDITVNLNILYRENWTRLAGQEMTKFQEQLVQRILQQMTNPSSVTLHSDSNSNNTAASNSKNRKTKKARQQKNEPRIEWNLAKSFLYSLTLLTTIGKYLLFS